MPQLGYQTTTEYVTRCPSCGDSENVDHGHLYVNKITGAFYCQKCGYKGVHDFVISTSIPENQTTSDNKPKLVKIQELPYSNRASNLNRFTAEYNNKLWDAFPTYDASGNELGTMLRRNKPKEAFMYGTRGIAYPFAPKPLQSHSSAPIRIVEGPYDVLDDKSVSVFGFLTYTTISKYFVGHYVDLMPDGDVWTKHKNSFMKTVHSLLSSSTIYLTGVYRLPDNLDIDETNEKIEYIPRSELLKVLP